MLTATPRTSQVLDLITAGLTPGHGRCIDLAPGVFLPLFVECIDDNLFSTAHHVIENGDAMPDPEVEWWRQGDGHWVPLASYHVTGHQFVAVELEGNQMSSCSPEVLVDLVSFCDEWIGGNFPAQQGGLDAIRALMATEQPVSQHRKKES
jgi:hypothetical protein